MVPLSKLDVLDQTVCIIFFMSQVSFLDNQLEIYIHDMQSIEEFPAFRRIGQLVEKMVEMKNNISYPLIYSLVTLALILPVATATVERAFLAMNIIKIDYAIE